MYLSYHASINLLLAKESLDMVELNASQDHQNQLITSILRGGKVKELIMTKMICKI